MESLNIQLFINFSVRSVETCLKLSITLFSVVLNLMPNYMVWVGKKGEEREGDINGTEYRSINRTLFPY